MKYFAWGCGYMIRAKNMKEAEQKAYRWCMLTLKEWQAKWQPFKKWRKEQDIAEMIPARRLAPKYRCEGIFVETEV